MLRGCLRWGPGYVRQRLHRGRLPPPAHVLFCMADHHEPFRRSIQPDGSITGGCTQAEALARLTDWQHAYRTTVDGILDADGYPPRHTFFYPWDEYDETILDALSAFCRQGYGEVEVHLHHRNDTEQELRQKLRACREAYAGQHGLLGRTQQTPGFAFVHGNWALCNSRPDGDWCGVNREIALLREAGCYLDLTYPSAPSATQPPVVNQIYYGGDPAPGACGHTFAGRACVGGPPAPAGLLMVPGPLGFDVHYRKRRWLPRLENAEVTEQNPPLLERFAAWRRIHIHVAGRPEWMVVKLHTHGLDVRSAGGVTGAAARQFHAALRGHCQAEGLRLHYVTARELYNIITAAEAGKAGNPGQWRNFRVQPPPACRP